MPDCTVSPGSGFILPVRTSRMVSLVNGACRSTSGKGKGSSGTWCGMLGCWQVGVGRCGLMQTERINNEYSKCLTYPTENKLARSFGWLQAQVVLLSVLRGRGEGKPPLATLVSGEDVRSKY